MLVQYVSRPEDPEGLRSLVLIQLQDPGGGLRTFDPRGISMTALTIEGASAPGERSCQGWDAVPR